MPTNTEREIKLAIARIRHGKQKRITADRKFSIAAVATEAGVSNATIHNRYPELADHIRDLQKGDAKLMSSAKRSENDALLRQIKDLRVQLLERENELKKIAIANLQMAQELKQATQRERGSLAETSHRHVSVIGDGNVQKKT